MPPFWLVLVLVCGLFAGNIWDPRCKYSTSRRCSGAPARADGTSSFDDWDGTKKYSTKVSYSCDEGLGFDTTNSPSKVYAYCGKMCSEQVDPEWAGWCDWGDPADCRLQDPQWRYIGFTGGSLPSCSVGGCSPYPLPLCSHLWPGQPSRCNLCWGSWGRFHCGDSRHQGHHHLHQRLWVCRGSGSVGNGGTNTATHHNPEGSNT